MEWLEGYLSQWEGAVLIVSHDRYFLDKVVDHIWEMRSDGLEIYRGNYSAYLQQRQERWELRRQIFEAEKERLVKEVDYIKRNIAGQSTLAGQRQAAPAEPQVEPSRAWASRPCRGKSWIGDQRRGGYLDPHDGRRGGGPAHPRPAPAIQPPAPACT